MSQVGPCTWNPSTGDLGDLHPGASVSKGVLQFLVTTQKKTFKSLPKFNTSQYLAPAVSISHPAHRYEVPKIQGPFETKSFFFRRPNQTGERHIPSGRFKAETLGSLAGVLHGEAQFLFFQQFLLPQCFVLFLANLNKRYFMDFVSLASLLTRQALLS